MTRSWCYRCGDVVTQGCHKPNGDFDPDSVEVTESEIREAAMAGQLGKPYHHPVKGPYLQVRSPETIRWNIAFGKHLDVYDNHVLT